MPISRTPFVGSYAGLISREPVIGNNVLSIVVALELTRLYLLSNVCNGSVILFEEAKEDGEWEWREREKGRNAPAMRNNHSVQLRRHPRVAPALFSARVDDTPSSFLQVRDRRELWKAAEGKVVPGECFLCCTMSASGQDLAKTWPSLGQAPSQQLYYPMSSITNTT